MPRSGLERRYGRRRRLAAEGSHAAIAPGELEVAPGYTIRTIGYNGAVPGPVVRFREGAAARGEIRNDTAAHEYVHWHGFEIPPAADGAQEEGSLIAPAWGRLRYRLTPQPAGSRYVDTHAIWMSDLTRGAFTGQFAFAWVEPRSADRRSQPVSLPPATARGLRV
jgi:FtsP/CotA-like multicopper oxidase with cupredoxin domain